MDTVFIFPSHPLRPRIVEPDFEKEYSIAKQLGNVGLFSLENAHLGNSALFVESKGVGIYRGWMLKIEKYTKLYKEALRREIILYNPPDSYRFYHHLVENHRAIENYTLKAKWIETKDLADERIVKVLQDLGSTKVVIKDWVKSRHFEWDTAMFIPNARDTPGALQIVKTFVERQGDDLIGGVVFREYKELVTTKSKSVAEWRSFWINGYMIGMSEVKGTKTLPDISIISEAGQKLGKGFFAMDTVISTDGDTKILEVGEGGVSSLKDSINMHEFYSYLAQSLQAKISYLL